MGFLQGKKILITGVLNNRSIAYGIARACHQQGAELAFTYQTERFAERMLKIAAEFNSDRCFVCDVAIDEQIDQVFVDLKKHWDSLDGLVHAIGYAPREAIEGDFLTGVSREAFRVAHDLSSYSFPALARAALPMMAGTTSGAENAPRGGSFLTLSYLGAERSVPNYNTMGLAKASLEAAVRYMAASLGPRGYRVNGISAGPIKTLAASGIGGFGKILDVVEKQSPLRRNVSLEDVGNAAAFLLSDLAAGVTGEILHVDAGFSTVVAGIGE